MKSALISAALKQVSNPNILVNMVSQRVRQLGQGHKPLIAAGVGMSLMDTALREIAEGKIGFELPDAPPRPKAARPKPRRKRAS
ncbi:MAG: DNA-directed RNA polymerase subunit omega [Verrucomicrobiae bacterium]|nr:DNA-directed RNA polymerase subunit omega [Verrucomicrobiae bacterium]